MIDSARGPRSSMSISATSKGRSSTSWRPSPTRATWTWRALAAYRDVGYPYMLMPDHVPQIDGRDPSGVAFAYCYGYIRALLDAMVPRPD